MAAEIKDFTRKAEPIEFKIDDDIFVARRRLNGGAAMKFAKWAESLGSTTDVAVAAEMLKKFFRMTLTKHSYRRMSERIDATLDSSKIDIDDLDVGPDDEEDEEDRDALDIMTLGSDVLPWIMEQYGLRPIEASPDSSDGQLPPGDGTNSTERQLPPESISPGSLSVVS